MATETPQPPSGDGPHSEIEKIIIRARGMDLYQPPARRLSKFSYAGGLHLPHSHGAKVILRQLREESKHGKE